MRKTLLYTIVFAGSAMLGIVSAQTGGRGGGGAAGAGGAGTPSARNNDGMQQAGAANSGSTAKVNDTKFAKEAAMGGMLEVQLGQKMVDDHTKANDDLKAIASKDSIELPTALDAKHQARLDKLSKLSGAAFDKAYVKDQLKDHQMDVREFQAESQGGTNADVKDFATKTLPVLQQHLDMVKVASFLNENKQHRIDKTSTQRNQIVKPPSLGVLPLTLAL